MADTVEPGWSGKQVESLLIDMRILKRNQDGLDVRLEGLIVAVEKLDERASRLEDRVGQFARESQERHNEVSAKLDSMQGFLAELLRVVNARTP